MDPDSDRPDLGGAIRIERTASLQDIVRRYTVFIDERPVGRLHAFQKLSFPVSAENAGSSFGS